MLTAILTKARDSRLVWDLFGFLYNNRIYGALHELYEHIAKDLRLTERAHVLDVGTGPGYMALHVAEQYPSSTVVGIDFSPMQVSTAERLRTRKKIGNCRFMKANAMRLPFEQARFDAVVSVGSIKHWPDTVSGLREIGRVLKTGGVIIISETDREVSREMLRNFLERFTAWYFWDPLLFWGMRRIVFGHSYSEEQIGSFLKTAGFREVQAERLEGCPYVIVKARKV
jgi:ubiquinone/menaquinone biosynthesis C-methylase UbiE